jgi:hypothetical protein
MRLKFWLAAGLLAAASCGCSGSGPTSAAPGARPGPHRGVLIALPGDKGYAEVVNSNSARTKARGKARPPVQVLVYFLNPGLDAPSTASASGVSVTLTQITDKPESIALQAAADAKDSLGKLRFESKPGLFYLANATGELSATLDGESFKAPFDGGMER